MTPIANIVPYSSPYNPNLPALNQKESSGELTGRLVVDYKFSDDVMGYASYSRGYRSGTYNGLAYQDVSQVYFLDPEKVNAYEVGLKTRLLENNALKRREIGVPAVEPRVEGADRDIGLGADPFDRQVVEVACCEKIDAGADQARHGLTAATLQARPHAGRVDGRNRRFVHPPRPRMTS